MQKMAGFSLLELLSVLSVSSILLFSVYSLFFHQQQRQYEHQNLLKADENVRLAFHLLKKQIQVAGEASCARVDIPVIYGFSDVIRVEKAAYERANLAREMKNPHDAIAIAQKNLFEKGDVVLITDCVHADFFVVNTVNESATGQVIYPQHLSRSYGMDAQVMLWQVDTFYLAPSASDPSILALYQKTLSPEQPAKELVAGIDTLQVQYALSGHTANFVSANEVFDWKKVKGVSISLGIQGQFNIVIASAARQSRS